MIILRIKYITGIKNESEKMLINDASWLLLLLCLNFKWFIYLKGSLKVVFQQLPNQIQTQLATLICPLLW